MEDRNLICFPFLPNSSCWSSCSKVAFLRSAQMPLLGLSGANGWKESHNPWCFSPSTLSCMLDPVRSWQGNDGLGLLVNGCRLAGGLGMGRDKCNAGSGRLVPCITCRLLGSLYSPFQGLFKPPTAKTKKHTREQADDKTKKGARLFILHPLSTNWITVEASLIQGIACTGSPSYIAFQHLANAGSMYFDYKVSRTSYFPSKTKTDVIKSESLHYVE